MPRQSGCGQIQNRANRLDDACWQTADFTSGMTQRKPHPGQVSTQKTKVWIVFDDENVYVGARLYDTQPDSIAAQLFRRDGEGYQHRHEHGHGHF